MKIDILTFHSARNYGAVLQCFALQEHLKQNGHEVYVIDYRPYYLNNDKHKRLKRNPLYYCIKTIIYKGNYKRLNPFKSFIQNKLNTYPTTKLDKQSFKAFICGSDQIWNFKICGNTYDNMYFAVFPEAKNAIKVSYGASMGSTQMTEEQKDLFHSLIKNFDAISVREENIKNFIYNEFGISSTLVLDPTLLVDYRVFDKIAIPPKRRRKYVLVYEIQHVEGLIEIAQKIAGEISAEVIQLNGRFSTYFKIGVKNIQGRTPEEFIGYFKEAAFVVTTSFHGTAF